MWWNEGEPSRQHLWDCGQPTLQSLKEPLAAHERIKDRAYRAELVTATVTLWNTAGSYYVKWRGFALLHERLVEKVCQKGIINQQSTMDWKFLKGRPSLLMVAMFSLKHTEAFSRHIDKLTRSVAAFLQGQQCWWVGWSTTVVQAEIITTFGQIVMKFGSQIHVPLHFWKVIAETGTAALWLRDER